MHKDIVVVGAGASGMMAAIFAARHSGGRAEVCLIEKNDRAGKKLLATGNGRCNFTNAKCTSWDYAGAFLEHRETRGFPEGVLFQASPKHMMEFFSEIGVLPRVEEEGRVYPYSGQGASVCQALLLELSRLGVAILYQKSLKGIEVFDPAQGGKERFRLTLSDEETLSCEKLILAVGGKAGCQYGSEGDGYAIAKNLGHTVIKPIPALVQLVAQDTCWPGVKGVRARARAGLYEGERKIREDRGEVQFTESGLSGICIFNLSRYLRYSGNPMEAKERYHVKLDFMEDRTGGEVLELLKQRKTWLSQREAENFLDGILHQKLSRAFMNKAGIPPNGRVCQLTQEQLVFLTELLKEFDVPITGTKSWKDAQVTAGGVNTAEICSRTMESAITPGLFFAGELMDVDAPCGGYNLQWAFASGTVAGRAAAESLRGEDRAFQAP